MQAGNHILRRDTSSPPRPHHPLKALLLASAALAFAGTLPARAVGTAAGTVITNQAYVDYKDANSNALPRVYSNEVTTTVSQVAGVDLVPATATDSGTNSTDVSFLIQIFNTGNGLDVYDFTYTVTSGWTPDDVQFYHDADNNHALDPTDPVLAGPSYWTHDGAGTAVPAEADDDYDMFMVVSIPAAAGDGTQSVIQVTATSRLDGSVTDFGTYTTQVSSAVITAHKTSDPHLPDEPVPGEDVLYTITLTNSGSTTATGAVVVDPIPAGLTYVPGSMKLNGGVLTDSDADGDGSDYDSAANTLSPPGVGTVTVTAGDIASGGGTATITFHVTVNEDEPSGTAVTNQATVTYKNNGAGPDITVTTNGHTYFIGTTAELALGPDRSGSADPGDSVTYPFTLTNNGNASDIFDITQTSSEGLTWTIWVDANNDGIAGNDGDYQLTDTDGDGRVETGSIAAGSSLKLLAVTTVPAGTPDATVDTTVVTATSNNDDTVSDPVTLTTTVTAPVLAITKSVSPTGNQPPGTVLTYTVTVTNNGTGTSTQVVVSDMVPQYTDFNSGSIKTGSTLANLTSRTDTADLDGAYYDSGNAVMTDPSPLGPGGVRILQFSVTIQ